MNTQEIFDKVAGHLLKQNEQSLDIVGDCMYRGINGMKCAIGCLIDDEHYDETLENENVFAKSVVEAVEDSVGRTLSKEELTMLDKLQTTHDEFPPGVWQTKLENLADEHLLVYNGDRYLTPPS